ncbi:MAG: reactive intermediate/imine deaminase [Candidatus Binatia bacterium]|nr:MAG: reactive intermediate/imine deaminase [Candidatus Binatia bacterium]
MAGPDERIRRIDAPAVGRLRTFSHATVAGDFVFVSGTLGTKPGTFELVAGGTRAETRQALENVRAILEAAGSTLDDVVKVQVYLTDMTTFGEMNEAYLEFFPENPPARITVGCAALALGAKVEIDCIALRRAG